MTESAPEEGFKQIDIKGAAYPSVGDLSELGAKLLGNPHVKQAGSDVYHRTGYRVPEEHVPTEADQENET